MQNQFLFDRELGAAVRVEAPAQGAPLHRWQRKALETGVGRISLDSQSDAFVCHIPDAVAVLEIFEWEG